ncbi:TPA: DUF551 domain-containing protein [Neisseria bacilliformis]
MTPKQIEQERAAFEAWVKGSKEGGLPVSLRKDKEKSYFNPLAEVSFMAWLARAEQTGWISVEDRLPQCECGIYLDIVYIDKEGERTISEGLYVPNFGFSFVKPTVRGGELDWDECEINTVTHWKYSDTLPPLPEGEKA